MRTKRCRLLFYCSETNLSKKLKCIIEVKFTFDRFVLLLLNAGHFDALGYLVAKTKNKTNTYATKDQNI